MGSQPVGIYSASGISAILGLNPYQTRLHSWQLIMEKLRPGFNAEKGYTLPEFPYNAPIRWGNGFENAIIKLAEEKDGCEIIDRERLFVKKFDNIELSCHTDGAYNDISGNYLVLHEGKTTNTRAFYSVKGEDYDDETGEIEFKRRWGDPGTDMVPEEYQIQCAVQRFCSGAELVKLSVLVFPKTAQDFEDLGWRIKHDDNQYYITNVNSEKVLDFFYPGHWAAVFSEIGQFHTYNLPKNEALESAIIKAVQDFDAKYVKTELPPEFEDYKDVRRLMTQPMGTIVATPEMVDKAQLYSENVRQLGKKGPVAKNNETLKTEIMNFMNTHRKDDWKFPNDKLVLIDPNGGDVLINFSKSGFRAKKA